LVTNYNCPFQKWKLLGFCVLENFTEARKEF
jgi:hypothetical protein